MPFTIEVIQILSQYYSLGTRSRMKRVSIIRGKYVLTIDGVPGGSAPHTGRYSVRELVIKVFTGSAYEPRRGGKEPHLLSSYPGVPKPYNISAITSCNTVLQPAFFKMILMSSTL